MSVDLSQVRVDLETFLHATESDIAKNRRPIIPKKFLREYSVHRVFIALAVVFGEEQRFEIEPVLIFRFHILFEAFFQRRDIETILTFLILVQTDPVLAPGDQFFLPEPVKAGPAQIIHIGLPAVISRPDQIVLRVKVDLRQDIPLHIFIHGEVDKPLHRAHKTENIKGTQGGIIAIPKSHNVSPGYRHHVPLIIVQCLCSDFLEWLFVEFVYVILFPFIGALVQFHILDISVFDATIDLERVKIIGRGQLVPNEINFDKRNPIVSFEQMNLAYL